MLQLHFSTTASPPSIYIPYYYTGTALHQDSTPHAGPLSASSLTSGYAPPPHLSAYGIFYDASQSAGAGIAIPAWSGKDEICNLVHRMSPAKAKGQFSTSRLTIHSILRRLGYTGTLAQCVGYTCLLVLCSDVMEVNKFNQVPKSCSMNSPLSHYYGSHITHQPMLTLISVPKANLAPIVCAGSHKRHVNTQPPPPEGMPCSFNLRHGSYAYMTRPTGPQAREAPAQTMSKSLSKVQRILISMSASYKTPFCNWNGRLANRFRKMAPKRFLSSFQDGPTRIVH